MKKKLCFSFLVIKTGRGILRWSLVHHCSLEKVQKFVWVNHGDGSTPLDFRLAHEGLTSVLCL